MSGSRGQDPGGQNPRETGSEAGSEAGSETGPETGPEAGTKDKVPFEGTGEWLGRRVLVTGGAGFIGSHLVEKLLEAGAEVTVLDDLSTGRLSNLTELLGRPGLTLREGTIMDRALLAECLRGADVVFHMAAVVGVGLVLEQPVRTLDVNVEGTRNVLRASAEASAGVLLASSSEVYGCAAEPPFREQDHLLFGATSEPRWSYAASKAIGEWEAFARAREEGLNATVVRLFNTVGPRQRGAYGMVLPRFVKAALAGEPLMVFGDGRQARSFCHVFDVVRALMALGARLAEARRGDDGRGSRTHSPTRVYNIGGDREVTIEALTRLVRRMADSQSQIVHMPYREAYGVHFQDLRRRRPDVSRLAGELGWRPTRDLVCTVRDLLECAREPARQ